MVIFLTTISLVHTATQSGQFYDITETHTESSPVIKESVKELKDSEKGFDKTVTQSLPIEEKSDRFIVTKEILKTGIGKVVKNPEPKLSKPTTRLSDNHVDLKSNQITLEKSNASDIDTQAIELNDLNNSEKNIVEPIAKKVVLEKPIKQSEIVSPQNNNILKSGEKVDSENINGINSAKRIVEHAKAKAKTKVIDKRVEEANNRGNSENNVGATAKNVDLEKPIRESEIVTQEASSKTKSLAKEDSKNVKDIDLHESSLEEPSSSKPTKKIIYDQPFLLLGSEVPPGTSTRLAWSPSQSFQGISAPTPVLVVNGVKPGPVLCLTAAVHGDELNGIEIVRRVLYNLKVEELSGTVIGVPIVNLQGFRRSSRYLPDRRDLNRFFPGDPQGSSASRIAYSFFHEIITHCNVLVDLHTGSFHRTNLPQLRADLNNKSVVDITEGFGATVIIQSEGAIGTLRRAALDNGIPAVTLEAGEPMRLQEDQVSHGVKGIQTLMNKFGMYDYSSFWGDPEPVYYQSKWVRANIGGILFSQVDLGEKVKPGDLLGTITDPITNVKREIISSYKGRIIGMALNQFVMPGFAAFHVGIHTVENELIDIGNKDKAELDDASENKANNTQLIVENENHKSEFVKVDKLYDTE